MDYCCKALRNRGIGSEFLYKLWLNLMLGFLNKMLILKCTARQGLQVTETNQVLLSYSQKLWGSGKWEASVPDKGARNAQL